ncbi:MAG: rhomboid family intramembrane serine protease [Rhizobiales bacterium]|nr:rhomboid family intramembrane serine protease [Hyphomicrobiales bacterium]
MFLPIHDVNRLKVIPFQYVTIGLIALNVVIFVLTSTGVSPIVAASFAVVPGELVADVLAGPPIADRFDAIPVPELWTLVSYMFLHGDLMHIGGNMLFLWVFGDNVEDAIGHFGFLVFYLLCGIFAGLLHTYVMPGSEVPLIGASGAISGCVAAYLMLHPRVHLWVLVARVLPLSIPAFWALGAWILFQFVQAYASVLETGIARDQTAWWAHVGGLVAGAILVVFMRRRGVPLFDRPGGVV